MGRRCSVGLSTSQKHGNSVGIRRYAHTSSAPRVPGSRGETPCSEVLNVNVDATFPSRKDWIVSCSSNCSPDVFANVETHKLRPKRSLAFQLACIR